MDWLIDGFIASVNGIRHAIILSPDGLTLGKAAQMTSGDADHLSALAAGAHSLARGAGQKIGLGEGSQTIIEMDAALLFITPAGRGTCLALLADAGADAGQIAYEMARLVKRVGQHMVANPRFPVRDPAAW